MMTYSVAPEISFCDAGGRFVFLDLAADRYFCLGSACERSFARLAAGEALTAADRTSLSTLERQGILAPAGFHGRMRMPPELVRPGRSLINGTTRASAAQVGVAALSLLRAKWLLRHRPLISLVSGIRRRKSELGAASPGRVEKCQDDIAGAYRRAALITGSLDQCLAVSLAVTMRLLAHGLASDLVFGVKLRPFQAHAWVQTDEVLISDRLDTVAPFTPILVI